MQLLWVWGQAPGRRWVPAGPARELLTTIPELRGASVCVISLGKLCKREPGWLREQGLLGGGTGHLEAQGRPALCPVQEQPRRRARSRGAGWV